MTNNSRSANGTLITDISDYQSQLLSMAPRLSSPDYVQLFTPPLTPPSSPAADNGSLLYQDGLTVLPTQILKHPARLAIECYHRRKFSKATLPKATLYEYSRKLAEEELDEQELYILSIFTWHVNGSIPVTWLLQQSHQLAAPSIELSESDCKALSKTFSQTMIDDNCTTFCDRYNLFAVVKLEEQAFKDKTWKLLYSLDYSFIAFLAAERAQEPLLELPINLRYCAQPALESFYEEKKPDVPTEFIQVVLDHVSPLVLAILALFTLDIKPSACHDAHQTDMSIDERSLLRRSIQELRIDRILDQFLKQKPAKRERLELVVRDLPSRLNLMCGNWNQGDVGSQNV